MTYYYSPSEKGFYTDELVYPKFPDDAVKLSNDQYDRLLSEINNGNKEIKLVNDELIVVDRIITKTWESVRKKRNKLLKNSDFTQMPDYPGDTLAYAIYRQKLRDIPQTYDNPDNVIWPDVPNKKL